MTTISATSILASRHATTGDRLDTLLLRYPRCIHSEFMTHRMFSRNAASSRAIPVEKLIQDMLDDPFVPIVWGKNQKGMQAGEECRNEVMLMRPFHVPERLIPFPGDTDRMYSAFPAGIGWKEYPVAPSVAWQEARDYAIKFARAFSNAGYHKQIVNRLLEPFSHITVVCSSTNWSNFLALRDHPDAEPHIQMLAREIRKALDDAEVQELQPGDWHLPFVTKEEIRQCERETYNTDNGSDAWLVVTKLKKLSAARCASTSYKTVDGFDMTIERAAALVDKLIGSTPLHASPFEHVAQADETFFDGEESIGGYRHHHQHGNFTGFRQWRKMLPNESL